MPIVFYVDPDMADSEELKNLLAITLSYTSFPVDEPEPVATGPKAAEDAAKGDEG